MPSVIRCLFTCCTYHWVELWLFRWPPGLQGAQSSRGVSLFTPLAGGTAPVATGAGDAVGLSPSSPPNTGHSIHVLYSRLSSPGKTLRYFPRETFAHHRTCSSSSSFSRSLGIVPWRGMISSSDDRSVGERTALHAEIHETTQSRATPVAG